MNKRILKVKEKNLELVFIVVVRRKEGRGEDSLGLDKVKEDLL